MHTEIVSGAEPVSRTYSSQGLTLHYLDWGTKGKPILLLVHGMMDHARSWDRIASALCQDWHVIVPDLRGHGDSDWSPDGAYLTPYYLQDLADLVAALECDCVSIVAHSFGGNPSARFAALYPERVRRLVLVDAMGPNQSVREQWAQQGTVVRQREWVERRQAAERPPRYFGSVEVAAKRLRRTNPQLTEDMATHLATHAVRQHSDGYSWKHDPRTGYFAPEDFVIHLSEYWRAITAPTLMCWGPKGWTTNPASDGSSEFFQQPHHQTFEQSGHWIHHDQPQAFLTAVREFLRA